MGMSDDSINTFNATIRNTDWYQDWFAQRGLNPNKVQLTKDQRNELKAIVEQNTGFQFPGDMKIDPAGNLNEKGGWAGLPKGVKLAIIAGAAVASGGVLGAFGGAAGGGAGASGTGAGLTAAAGAPTAASTGMGLGMGSGGFLGMGGGTLGAVSAAAGGGSTLNTVNKIARKVTGGSDSEGGSTMDRIGELMRAGAGAVGAAGEAAAQRRDSRNDDLVRARNQDISAESNFQDQQLEQAKMEAVQRDEARKALYRASVMKNPTTSSEYRGPGLQVSPEMMEGLSNLEKQALSRTAEGPMYNTSQMRKPRDFAPLELTATPQPSTMETISNWAAPGLKIGDILTRFF
jgi:hypothetical protein